MENRLPRQKFQIANKYQRIMLLPTLITNTILMVIIVGLLAIFFTNLFAQILNKPPVFDLTQTRTLGAFVLFLLLYCNLMLVIWGYRISHRLAGPLGRIERELQELSEGKNTSKRITLRDGDYLNEIIEKLNKIMEKIS